MSDKSKIQKVVKQLNVIDDTLFEKMAEDLGFCEETISTILEQKVKVLRVVPQNSVKNLQGRSVVLDALCELENGRSCTVEVQKANDDDHEKRVRYNTSCVTANITDPGSKFEKVPDMIGILISKFDIFKEGKTVYHVDRVIRETGTVLDNGLHEIYVNAKIDDGSDIAELMKIYKNQEVYDFEKFPKTSKRKHQFLIGEEGEDNMCEVVENYAKEYAKECIEEEARATAHNLFKNGVSFELVRDSIKGLSDETLKLIYDEVVKK